MVVIWALGLLAALAASLTMATRTSALISANAIDNAQAEALADAGARLAILGLGRSMADPPLAQPMPIDGIGRQCTLGGAGRLTIAVESESGKVDINTASDALLQRLIEGLGAEGIAAATIVDRIADFRDADDLRRLNGAEADDYRKAGLAHGPKNAPFSAVEELHEVMGLSPALAERLGPLVTVYSGASGIDPRVASPDLLSVLLVPAGAQANDALKSPGSANALAAEALPQGFVSLAAPRVFLIRSQAETASGARFVREAIVEARDLRSQRFAVLRWYRGQKRTALNDKSTGRAQLPPCQG